MAKYWFLLAGIVLSGVFTDPTFFATSHHLSPKAPAFQTVETASAAPETADQPLEVAEASQALASVDNTNFIAAIPANAPVPTAATANINYHVTTPIGSVDQYLATYTSLSYSELYRFQKMIYGHNTANLLGNLASLAPGQVFSVTEGGVTTSYRVALSAVYANTANGLNGDPSLMSSIAYSALGHSIALLTCAGTPYGNGNASHRLVVFADQI